MKRALLLLRRATAAFYFTSAQVEKLLDLIPNAARVRYLPFGCSIRVTTSILHLLMTQA
eukprot:COSAG02_NODE_2764_length_8071_cov_2.367536_5_plen_59_part_00